MKTSSIIFGLFCTLVVALSVIQVKINNLHTANRARKDKCLANVAGDKDAQLVLLDYQIDNRYLNYSDSIGSKEYIDFLEQKADTACNENK